MGAPTKSCVFFCVQGQAGRGEEGGEGGGGREWGIGGEGGIFQKSIRAVVIAAAEGPAEGRQKVSGPPGDKGAFSMILEGPACGPF